MGLSMSTLKKPITLVIMDGWGINTKNTTYNAIAQAKKPNFDKLWKEYPHTELGASGHYVGLPDGQMGNSEVGHINIGTGRVVYQDLTRISKEMHDNKLPDNKVLVPFVEKIKAQNGALHLMGLVSDGGVHSHQEHLYGLLKFLKPYGLPVYIHAFLDGRDVPPKSAGKYLDDLQGELNALGFGQIATISGRFYSMDRDRRWSRIHKAYNAIIGLFGDIEPDYKTTLEKSYASGVTDEFVVPTILGDYKGMTAQDGIIFFNFRPDRARELAHVFTADRFPVFPRVTDYILPMLTFTDYGEQVKAGIMFPKQRLDNTLGCIISQNNLKQLRLAETEKYAHVTFFFNAGVEEPFLGEERILVPSPKVVTYDLQPEMSSQEVTAKAVEAILSKKYDFIIMNYANGDMVGHTGQLEAAIKAVEAVDKGLGAIYEAVEKTGGILCITADHGNAEKMRADDSDMPFTAHTTNPVPFILIDDDKKSCSLREGGALCDIAPTLLELANLSQPKAMTGHSLIKND